MGWWSAGDAPGRRSGAAVHHSLRDVRAGVLAELELSRTGGEMSFRQESRKLAEAMGEEHRRVGELLEEMEPGEDRDSQSECVVLLRKAHEAVEFQKKRVQAAQGVRK